MHGNEWRGVYQPLDQGALHALPTGGPNRNSNGGIASQEWLRVDALGNVTTMQADRQRLVMELSIPFRDLRTLDPSLRVPYPIALFVRAKAIIVNFESLRIIITHDEAFVLSAPVPGESLLVGQPAKPQGAFVKHLRYCIRGHGPHGSMSSADTDSSKQPVTPEQAELPFELRCLEAALETALSVMAAETAALEMHTAPLFNRVSRKVARAELELLRDCRSGLSKLTNRVSKLKQEVETVLNSEAEMDMMYLGRRFGAQSPQPEQQQPQQQAEAEQPGHRRGRRPSNAAAAAATADEADSDDEWEAHAMPAADADEPRRPSAERRASGRDHWKHSVRQVNRMLSTLQSMQSMQSTLQSDKSTWSCANLLDSNLMHCDHLMQRLEVLKERLTSTEKFINAELDHRRNELVSLDVFVTGLMSMFAFVSMVAGIFGMNLTNGWESSHVMFLVATWGSSVGAVAIFASIMFFAWSRHLLLIPDTSTTTREPE